jgi:hypothetical protein
MSKVKAGPFAAVIRTLGFEKGDLVQALAYEGFQIDKQLGRGRGCFALLVVPRLIAKCYVGRLPWTALVFIIVCSFYTPLNRTPQLAWSSSLF